MTLLTNGNILAYMFIINIFAYFLYFYDKKQAVKEEKRVSENILILFVIFGGVLGSATSMIAHKHKTNKFSFVAKYLLANLCFIFFIYLVFMQN